MKKILLLCNLSIPASCPGFPQYINPKTENVIVVFKTHFDIGYTDYAESVMRKYQTSMIEGALDRIDENTSGNNDGGFSRTMPSWPMKKIFER